MPFFKLTKERGSPLARRIFSIFPLFHATKKGLIWKLSSFEECGTKPSGDGALRDFICSWGELN